MTLNEALPGDSPDYQKKGNIYNKYKKILLYNNNHMNMFSVQYAPSGILGPNHCRLRLRRRGDIRRPETWGLHQHFGTFAMEHTFKKAPTPHT
jgi:hypothetical protein